jgi:hypothetical protein
MEITPGGIMYPSGDDLASAGACRMFAESVDARITAANRVLDGAQYPSFAIAKPSGVEAVYPSSGFTSAVQYDTIVAESATVTCSDFFGFTLSGSAWTPGIYMVGAMVNFRCVGAVNWVSCRVAVRDWRGPIATTPHIDYIESLTGPTARADEYNSPASIVEIHAPQGGPGATVWVELWVNGGTRVDHQPTSNLWMYRLGDLQNA